MGTTERRTREKQETRRKIVDAARRLFAEEGYDAVSMRRIADAIEYTPTAIYVHFKDKAELFRDICRCDFLKLADVERSLRTIADPIERIAELGRAYIKFGVEHPNHYRLMFMTPHEHALDDADLQRKNDPDQDAYAFLRMTVEEALDAGRFRPDLKDAAVITQTLWAAVHGVASLAITKKDDPWIDWSPIRKRTDVMVDSILAGLTAGAKSNDAKAKTATKRKGGAR